MEEELICEQCRSSISDPLWLSCCSVNICKSHVRDICPVCSKSLEISDIEPNYILKYIVQPQQIETPCDRCERNRPVIYCSRCNARMCKECSSYIHSLGIFNKHTLRPLDRNLAQTSSELCEEHNLPLSLFCSEDWTPICQKCRNHAGHAVLSLNETYAEVIAELSAKEQKLKMKSKITESEIEKCDENSNRLQEDMQKAKENFKKSFDKLRECIQWKEEELMLELMSLMSKRKLQVDSVKENLNERKAKLGYVFKLLEASKNVTPTQLLSCIKYITHKVEAAMEAEEVSCDNIEMPNLAVQLGKVKKHIDMISIQDAEISQAKISIPRSDSPITPRSNLTPDVYNSPILTPTPTSEPKIKRPSLQTLENLRKSFVIPNPFEMSSSVPALRSPVFSKGRQSFNPTNVPASPRSSSEPSIDTLDKRVFILIQQTATSIKLSWNHPIKPASNLEYCLEYGIGTKVQGLEQFREVYHGSAKTCIVTDLLPKTSYRFRVKALTPQESGDWSDTITVSTLPTDSLDANSCKNIANVSNRNGEKWIQFERPGTVLGTNVYLFGVHTWEVRVLASNMFTNDEEGWTLKVGVANSRNKSIVYGVVIPSSSARGHIRIKVCLDVEKRKLTCYTPSTPEGESVSVSEGTMTPAIQFKPGKSLRSQVKCNLKFE
jgi:hypothetical protein